MAVMNQNTSYENICSCGKHFKGDAFPDTELIPDEAGSITGKDGTKGRIEWVPATVKDGCKDCISRLEKEVEEKYYVELDALPLEERVRRIEKWIRNFKHQEQWYVPPPRY